MKDLLKNENIKVIDAAKSKGYSKEQIIASLREKGWPSQIIKKIIK